MAHEAEKIAAACRVIAGAQGVVEAGQATVEIGHAGEWVPDHRAFWASARTPGGRFFAEGQPSAAEAMIVLAEKLLQMGRCSNCGRPIQILRTGAVALGTGDQGLRRDTCLWARTRDATGIVWAAAC